MMTDTQLSPDLAPADTVEADDEVVPNDAATAADAPTIGGNGADAVDDLRRFRAATYEEALADARAALGAGLRVVEANRIRRGGLGGFFATDLGIEIAVVATEEAGVVDGVTAERTGNPIEDATAGGALLGQSLGMTDARLRDLLQRAERRDHANGATFADHLARAGVQQPTDVAQDPAVAAAAHGDTTVEEDRFVPRLPPRTPMAATPPPVVEPAAPVERPRLPERGPIGAIVRTAPPGFVSGCDVVGDPATVPDAIVAPAPTTIGVPTDGIVNARPALIPDEVPADGIVSARPATAPVAPPEHGITRRRSTAAPITAPPDDMLARPTRLAAAATDRLMLKLGRLRVAEGSKLSDLNRLSVSVTTADGSQIEMTAELAADADGART